MNNVSIIDVVDRDSEQNAQVIVRSVRGFVALTLTLEHEGDVQVVISPAECEDLIVLLQQAVQDAQAEAAMTRQNVAELQAA